MEGVYVNSGRGCKGLGLPPSGSIYAANHASDARRRMHVHSPNSETQNPTPQLPSPGWHGRLCDLDSDALSAFWAQALQYTRWEIGRYSRWRGQDEPVLPDGYDAEGIVQAAFVRLLQRQVGAVPILYTAKELQHDVQSLVKHRVRWLHERSETQLVVGEWDVLPPRSNGERVSIFDYLPGKIAPPDAELMEKEKQQFLAEFKEGFEKTLADRQNSRSNRTTRTNDQRQLLDVFERVWGGEKRRDIAAELGLDVNRVKALQSQLRRRLTKFAADARAGIVKVLVE